MFQYNRAKLYDTMWETLYFCDVSCGKTGIDTNLDMWENKSELVEVLRKHPKWNEDAMAVIVEETYTESVDRHKLNVSCRELYYALCDRNEKSKLNAYRKQFESWEYLIDWSMLSSKTITGEMLVCMSDESRIACKPVVGQKTTRFIRQFLLAIGVPEEDKKVWDQFQRLADIINADNRIHTDTLVVSVNPADFLTMSYGTNWASCHIINPEISNGGSDYDGCYKAGCLSYLGDASTLIAYTVNGLPEDIEELPMTPRLTRQLFFVNVQNDFPIIMQSRMYPYVRDEARMDARMDVVQGIIAQCYAMNTSWSRLRRNIAFKTTYGSLHYRDYECASYFTAVPKQHDDCFNDTGKIVYSPIGNIAYCLECGERIYDECSVLCSDCNPDATYCADCGARIHDDDDIYWVDGEAYCGNCVSYCEYHEEYEHETTIHVIGFGEMCEYAIGECEDVYRDYYNDNYYYGEPAVIAVDRHIFSSIYNAHRAGYYECKECGDWCHEDEMRASVGDTMVCDYCYDRMHYAECPHCGIAYDTRHHYEETCPECGVILEELKEAM